MDEFEYKKNPFKRSLFREFGYQVKRRALRYFIIYYNYYATGTRGRKKCSSDHRTRTLLIHVTAAVKRDFIHTYRSSQGPPYIYVRYTQ